MKILHTADWHLGQKLYNQERYDEHQKFLDWLIGTLNEHQIDLLLVSGDIFDLQNPPNKAVEIYYNFLANLIKKTSCQYAIITGGNHDSSSNLDSARELLKSMKLYIVGGTSEQIEDEIIEIRDEAGNLQAVVCAVPFLRDKDINYNRANLDISERESYIIEAITEHYSKLADEIKKRKYSDLQIPIIAMGHLFAQGCRHSENEEFSEAEKNIYVGNLGKVPAETFPEIFNYVALGHLHSSQMVGGKNHIRYSGSPIPLSFSERRDKKSVLLIEFEGSTLLRIDEIKVPDNIYRKLKRFEGTLEDVLKEISRYLEEAKQEIWAEVVVQVDTYRPDINSMIEKIEKKVSENSKIKILKIAIRKNKTHDEDWIQAYEHQNLQDVSPEEVFIERCKKEGLLEQEVETQLMPLFWQVIEELQENNPD